MSDTILDVQGLTVEFGSDQHSGKVDENGVAIGGVRAVDGISFQLQRGQTLGIVGESGSGKSVTSLAVMGLVPEPPGKVTNGQIIFKPDEGPMVDLRQVPKRKMRKYRGGQIAMIFQEPMSSLNPVYSCGFQLIEAIRQHQKISKRKARNLAISQLQEVKLLPPEVEHFEEVQRELNTRKYGGN